MKQPLFDGQVGEVVNVALAGFAARWDFDALRRDPSRREEAMKVSDRRTGRQNRSRTRPSRDRLHPAA